MGKIRRTLRCEEKNLLPVRKSCFVLLWYIDFQTSFPTENYSDEDSLFYSLHMLLLLLLKINRKHEVMLLTVKMYSSKD